MATLHVTTSTLLTMSAFTGGAIIIGRLPLHIHQADSYMADCTLLLSDSCVRARGGSHFLKASFTSRQIFRWNVRMHVH